MKKIFIALSVLVALAFGAVPSMAVEGTVDDVLTVDVTVPAFLISRTATTMGDTENTLVAISEMMGIPGVTAATSHRFHGFIYDINSNQIFDWWFRLTAFDAEQFYVSTVLELFAVAGSPALAPLEITLNGETFYTGYIIIENFDNRTNANLGAWVYQVALANGRASAAKLPAREWALGAVAADQGAVVDGVLVAGTGVGTAYGQRQINDDATVPGLYSLANYEGWSAFALAHAQERAMGLVETRNVDPALLAGTLLNLAGAGGQAPSAAITNWNLWFRYYLFDSSAETFWFVWFNRRLSITAPAFTYKKHATWWNEDEAALSVTIPLSNELNIIDVREYVPVSHITGTNDYGMCRITWTAADVLNPLTARVCATDMVTYTYQQATGAAAQSWNILERGYTVVGT